MRLNGVPKEGKRIQVTDRLSLQIPSGVAYGKDDDGHYNMIQYQSLPKGYKNGSFTADDEEEVLWSITGLKEQGVITFEAEDDTQLTPEAVREVMRSKIVDIAKSMVQEDNSSKEPYEPGSSTKVEETEDGFVLRSGISINAAGGSYRILELSDKLVGAVVKKGFQLFGITMYFTYLFLAVEDCPEAPLFYATLKAPDESDFYEKTLEPILKTAELAPSKKTQKPKIKRDAAPTVKALDFSQGERVRAGEFSILVPGGMCWSGEISPETRYLSSVPESVSFDDPDWDEVSAIKFTLQTGQKIPAIQEALNSAAGEKQIQDLLGNMSINVAQQGISNDKVGKVVPIAREAEYYICYELAQKGSIDCVFRYYIFSHTFVYFGQYIGWNAGLKDPAAQHAEILEKWLQTVRYEGDTEAELARYGRTQFGEYAAQDGKLNGVRIAQLFSDDVLFFNEDDFKETGLKNGVHFNSLKMSEHPFLVKNRDVFAPEIVSLLLELDAIPELRVPKGKLHKRLIPLLFNDNDEPLTGMTMMNLLAYHMLRIQELGTDDYAVVIDRNLVAGIPDAYRYVGTFLRQLRLYNGKNEAFTITFANMMNFDTPIQGALKPVDGAVQLRSMYRLQVEPDGGFQELEAAEDAGLPEQGAQRSIQELEKALPPEFTAKMSRFSENVADRLGQLCRTLQTSSYNDLSSTEEVLDRLMDQAGDYSLAWGIYNFYSIFTLGASDNSFTYEKDGQRDISGSGFECPGYRVDEQYEDYAEGDPDFQPDEFPRQLAERIRGITREEIYRTILEQAVGYQEEGYTIVDQERIRIEKQQKALEKVPFDRVTGVAISGSAFVLTGEFEHCGNDREAIKGKIQAKGGRCTQAISGKTNYLVIGGLGDFGARKLEQVQAQRAKGSTIKIIREEDLFAALEGRPISPKPPQKTGAAAPKEPESSTKSGSPHTDRGAHASKAEIPLPKIQVKIIGPEDSQQASYDSACQSMETAKTAADLRKAAKAFGALEGYRDSSERKVKCQEQAKKLEAEQRKKKAEEKARQEKELAEQAAAKQRADYDSACQSMEKAKSITAFRKAAKAFEALGEYRDSAERRAQCLERVKALEEEQQRKKAEEQARLEKEQAEKAAAEQALREKKRAQQARLRKKLLLAAALVVVAIGIFFGVRSYINNAPYRELARSIDEGTFHYSQYDNPYFLRRSSSCKVIADKLTDFHHGDDIQSAVNLIGSLPPDEGILDYYIDGSGIYMTDSFRQWFAGRAEEEGTEVTVTGVEADEDRDVRFYQMGDFLVEVRYDISDPDEPRLMQALVIDPEAESRITLGSNRVDYYGDQYGIE